MNLDEHQLHEALDALTEDGDRYEVTETCELRLHIDVDTDAEINDYDCYGKSEKYSHSYFDSHERTARPSDMDGSARKIQCGRGDWIWWQPADDLKSPRAWAKAWRESGQPAPDYNETFREHLETATHLLSYGFSLVGLSVWETVYDSLNQPHKVQLAVTYLGGIDSVETPYLRDLVSDMIADLADGLNSESVGY